MKCWESREERETETLAAVIQQVDDRFGSAARPDARIADLRGLQPLLLNKIHHRHDGGGLRQLDAQLLHDRPEVRQELVERFLALPHVEDLKLAVFTEACMELHRAFRSPGLTKTVAPLGVLLNSHVLGDDVNGNHGK
jgi:hypothetical protein